MSDRCSALVTGAGRGIGRQIALTLACNGYDIVAVDGAFVEYREYPDGQEKDVREELAECGADVVWAEALTTEVAAMNDVVDRALTSWGRIDSVVCNAGGGSGPITGNRASTIDLDDLTEVLHRNLYGTITTVSAALSALERSSRGSIVTMSSLNGVETTDNGRYAHYGIAKAAVVHYTRYLARDLREKNIRANCLAPGRIATGKMIRKMKDSPSAGGRSAVPMDVLGTTTDVAEMALYLVSDRAKFINGQVLRIDGGV